MTAITRDLPRTWKAARTPLIIGLFLLLAAVAVAGSTRGAGRGQLNPDAADDSGSRAIAQLLRADGVPVDVVRRAAEVAMVGPDSTVLVPFPERLAPAQLQAVRESGADVVLVAPGPEVAAELAPGVEITALGSPVDVLDPACDLPAAARAGPAELGGELYRGGGALTCYGGAAGAALARVTGAGRSVTLLGAPDVLTNARLAEEGNAALALGLLGGQPRLVWFMAVPEGPPVGDERSLFDLADPGWGWGAAQLAVAALLAILWRARRLGPVVAEPLPVVVRAAEAVEGRARLYRRATASAHAAQTLRVAARARLAPLVGLPDTAEPPSLVEAVAARTSRSSGAVGALLYGPAPVDDAALIALADMLDACEREVRRS